MTNKFDNVTAENIQNMSDEEFDAYADAQDAWSEETLNEPEVKELIESGEWEQMSRIEQIWFVLDLTPTTLDAVEWFDDIIAKADAEYYGLIKPKPLYL
ncbi:MAG: hypothetical protein LBI10_02735 [Deltaproteobacteria bacterium]|jgi:hypothetical protein|nr:hypothetical protein [Deltaproteobacteria bacterium]